MNCRAGPVASRDCGRGLFTRLQEFGPDTESAEDFIWVAPEVSVAINFAPSEAVARYRIGAVTPCPCAAN